MTGPVTLEQRGDVALVTLNRPERLNAMSLGLMREFHAVLAELPRSTARVVVLTGAGRAFCAGMDVKESLAGTAATAGSAVYPAAGPGAAAGSSRDTDTERLPRGSSPAEAADREGPGRIQRIFELQTQAAGMITALRDIPQPVVAAVHGPAVGAGFMFALAADLRVADATASFAGPWLKLGFAGGDMGSSWLLPRVVGFGAAAEIIYRARTVDSAEAMRIGLVTEVTPVGTDVEVALRVAGEIAALSPFGLRHTKELLNLSLDIPGLRRQLAVENRTQVLAFLTEDLAEGMSAALAKRPPEFRDR